MSTQAIAIDRIRIDGDTQPRCEIDMGTVAEYADDLERGEKLPPGEAFFDGKDYWLWDGFHRYHGHRKAGRKKMSLVVVSGTVEDARWAAAGANKTHGLRRSNPDKRRAVEMALKARPRSSDRGIAEQCGVSHNFAGEVRRSLSSDDSRPASRTGRDGRTINTSNIGKRKEESEADRDDATQGESGGPADGELWPDEVPGTRRSPLETTDSSSSGGRLGKNGEYISLDDWSALGVKDRKAILAASDSSKRLNDQGTNENIEWALWSWNPVTGCRHNCPYCYARDIANRFYEPRFEPSLWASRLQAPFNTGVPADKIAIEKSKGTREGDARAQGLKTIFTCSMADLFGRWVPDEWINAVLDVARRAPQWNFLFLTKFPIRMAEFDFPENAWVGTTVDCQARVANAEKAFRQVKAGVKWLSCEPLIEPLTFKDIGAFDWLVLGGASASTQTPEWTPPRGWVTDLEAEARRSGVRIYEKSNLGIEPRIREYPGVEPAAHVEAPEELRYLPEVK